MNLTRSSPTKFRFTRYLLACAGVTWFMYAVSFAPHGQLDVVKGLLKGAFCTALMWSTITLALSLVSAWRDRNLLNLLPATLILPLVVLCWWHMVFWPIVK